MSLKINDNCIACDACREECPNGAISENDPIYIIDSEFCTECVGSFNEPQCIEFCPVECIEIDENNFETALELSLKYKQIQELR
ncbi:MAG: ferredoxin [Epsilonproteobacteria bacterium]|nr:MAG: ferredoxin [Campylobacterota bacterium]